MNRFSLHLYYQPCSRAFLWWCPSLFNGTFRGNLRTKNSNWPLTAGDSIYFLLIRKSSGKFYLENLILCLLSFRQYTHLRKGLVEEVDIVIYFSSRLLRTINSQHYLADIWWFTWKFPILPEFKPLPFQASFLDASQQGVPAVEEMKPAAEIMKVGPSWFFHYHFYRAVESRS